MTTRIVQFAAIGAFAALSVATLSFAQEPVSPQIDSTQGVESGTEVTVDDALAQSASGATIPLSVYNFSGPRGAYTGVLVGGSPFNPTPVTINAVLIPLIIQVCLDSPCSTVETFDPTAPDSCDPNDTTPVDRFLFSPLVLPANLTFNGVSVGTTQYIDGFMKAEWWKKTGGSSSYSNFINWVFASAVSFPPLGLGVASVIGTGCSEEVNIPISSFKSTMTGTIIPTLQKSGVISPTKFAFFLMKSAGPNGGGLHNATGNPVQTWAAAPYKVKFDVEIASHEIGEWMNDPLTNNATPKWGFIGEKKDECASNFEVGDPLNFTTVLLKSVLSPYTYHVQELAFFSWFYDAEFATSVGAGGKFSSNGTFTLPSKPCPPGGSYQPLTITTPSPLPNGVVTIPYSTTLQATGGRTLYSWSVASGALPTGLTLSSVAGSISGTPTNAG